MIDIGLETAADGAAVEGLLDRAFGPGRHRKTAQRLRDGRLPADGLAFTAMAGEALVGTLRFWDVALGDVPGLLLGPVAVDPNWQGRGIGAGLIEAGLDVAAAQGHDAVILVGDPAYYRRFGFGRHPTLALDLPGPFEAHRFLGLELVPGAMLTAEGMVRATGRRVFPWLETREPILAGEPDRAAVLAALAA